MKATQLVPRRAAITLQEVLRAKDLSHHRDQLHSQPLGVHRAQISTQGLSAEDHATPLLNHPYTTQLFPLHHWLPIIWVFQMWCRHHKLPTQIFRSMTINGSIWSKKSEKISKPSKASLKERKRNLQSLMTWIRLRSMHLRKSKVMSFLGLKKAIERH